MENQAPKKNRVMVFGANGMLGHVLCARLVASGFTVYPVFRNSTCKQYFLSLGIKESYLRYVRMLDKNYINQMIPEVSPLWIINCAGAVKQKMISKTLADDIWINAVFPHLLSNVADRTGSRLSDPLNPSRMAVG